MNFTLLKIKNQAANILMFFKQFIQVLIFFHLMKISSQK